MAPGAAVPVAPADAGAAVVGFVCLYFVDDEIVGAREAAGSGAGAGAGGHVDVVVGGDGGVVAAVVGAAVVAVAAGDVGGELSLNYSGWALSQLASLQEVAQGLLNR